ncbi:hypothetical protein ABPG74_021092 [Tetrahymena malaccensis]
MFPYEVILHGIAGSIAAVMSTCLLFPIDQIKTHLQLSEKNNSDEDTSITTTIKKIHKTSGIQGFYRGIIPVIFGNIVSQFVYFFWYNFLKIATGTYQSSMLQYAKCSMLAGLIASICTNPFWVLQTRMLKSKGGVITVAMQMYQEDGLKAFFKGLSTSLILVTNPIINYMIYESYKVWAQSLLIDSKYDALIFFFGGALGKFFATVATYPYQLLRTKAHIAKEQGYLQMIKTIYIQGGIPAFFRGLLPKLSQTVLANAFNIMFYEQIFKLLEKAIIILHENQVYHESVKVIVLAAFLYVAANWKINQEAKPEAKEQKEACKQY